MHLGDVKMLYLLWLVPVLAAFFVWASYRRSAALRAFVDDELLGRIGVSINRAGRVWKGVLLLLAFSAVALAAARPQWNPKPQTIERKGRDIMILLDVSKSMLAEDLAPNRLERAKIAIKDMVEGLQGDRVGLIAFAGSAVVKVPLTTDYGFFDLILDDIDVESVSRGGTKIGDAVRKAMDEGFDNQEKKYKDIILITDGEDHDSFPVEAAEEAGQKGIRVIAIGLGDENQGRRIPVTDNAGNRVFMTYNGQEVWSKLDASTLRKMANATPGGKYLNVATGTIDLGDVYLKLIAGEEKRDIESKTMQLYEEKFQIFLGAALLLLVAQMVVGERKRGKR
jgi:Ca-activated chloride channel family protein